LGRSVQTGPQWLPWFGATHRNSFSPVARNPDAGTNDFQFSHPYSNAWSTAQGIATLVSEIRRAPLEPGMLIPPILIVCPPPILSPVGPIAAKFAGAEERCLGLADAYRAVSSDLKCHFFDAGSVTPASRVDGIHLDADQHLTLGLALADVVIRILKSG
jgi:lysophospholipase L1-like esterase